MELRRQASVHAQDLVVYASTHWQAVETICERLPQADAVAPFALVVKAVYPVDGCALVVATQKEEILGALDLVGKEQADSLQAMLAPVDIIAKEEVVRLRREATALEESQDVRVLAMGIA